MNIWLVFHDNYGDQGVDFKGAFATKEIAELWLKIHEQDKNELRWYDIREVEVQEQIIHTVKYNFEQSEYIRARLKSVE